MVSSRHTTQGMPLSYMSPEQLRWEAEGDVTLIRDAAHVTTPFAGGGVDVAILDSVML